MRFRRYLPRGCLACLFALFGCQHDAARRDPAPTWASGPVQWGEPVNGLQIGLSRLVIVLPPRSVRSRTDAPAYIELHLRNVGDAPLKLVHPQVSCGGRHPGRPVVEATLVTRDGDKYRSGYLSASPRGMERVVELPPGTTRVVSGQFGASLWLGPYIWGLGPETQGECRLSYHNRQASTERRDEQSAYSGLWVGDVETGPIPVTFDDEAETQMD